MLGVLDSIISLCNQYIQFPYREEKQIAVKREFHCSHVAIKAPRVNSFNFVNKKQYLSINVQLISDACLSLLNVVAKWNPRLIYSSKQQCGRPPRKQISDRRLHLPHMARQRHFKCKLPDVTMRFINTYT